MELNVSFSVKTPFFKIKKIQNPIEETKKQMTIAF
jgi:hypothetical protein